MADIATLGVAVDTSQVKAAAGDLDKLTASAVKVETATGAIEASARRAGVTVEQYRQRMAGAEKSTSAIRQETERMELRMRSATRQVEMVSQAKQKLTAANDNVTRATRGTASALDQLSQAAGLAAGGGAVAAVASQASNVLGTLTRLNPVLLATGLALGGVAVAAVAMGKSAMHIADFAGELRDTAETTGFTTDQLQGLKKLAMESGVSAGKLTTGIERFTFSLKDAKEASGELFLAIQKADPALAQQFLRTKTTAEAFEVLAKAYAKTTDEADKVAMSRRVFGRGGAGIGRMLDELVNIGGIQKMVDAMDPLDRITRKQADDWDKLGDAISYNVEIAKRNIVAAFAGPVLEVIKDLSERFIAWSREVKNFKTSEELKSLLTDWSKQAVKFFENLGTAASVAWGVINQIVGGINKIGDFLDRHGSKGPAQRPSVERTPDGKPVQPFKAGDTVSGGTTAGNWVVPSAADVEKTTAQMERLVGLIREAREAEDVNRRKAEGFTKSGLLENAAMSTQAMEKWAQRADKYQRELDDLAGTKQRTSEIVVAANDKEVDSDERLATKKEEVKLSATTLYNQEARRIERLGDAATAQERYNLEVLKSKSLLEDKKTTEEVETRVITEATTKMLEQTNAIRTQMGVVTERQLQQLATAKVERAIADGIITGEKEIAIARQVTAREAREQFEAAQARASALPNLTRTVQDWANPLKQVDQFATSALSGMENAFASIITKAKDFKTAIREMATAIMSDFAKMGFRSIMGPLMSMGLGALGGGSGGALAGLGSGGVGIGGFTLGGVGHKGATIGSSPVRGMDASIWAGAARYHKGTMNLQPNEVPFIGERGEIVGQPDDIRKQFGGDTNLTFAPSTVIQVPPGTQQDQIRVFQTMLDERDKRQQKWMRRMIPVTSDSHRKLEA